MARSSAVLNVKIKRCMQRFLAVSVFFFAPFVESRGEAQDEARSECVCPASRSRPREWVVLDDGESFLEGGVLRLECRISFNHDHRFEARAVLEVACCQKQRNRKIGDGFNGREALACLKEIRL